MRKTLTFLLILSFLAGCQSKQKVEKEFGEDNMEKGYRRSPFKMYLSVIDGPGLKAVIKNGTSEKHLLNYDSFFNPVVLHLIDKSGREIKPGDERVAMDHSGKKQPPEEMAPGGEFIIEREFEIDGGGIYKINWELYIFMNIKPGKYEAYAEYNNGSLETPGTIRSNTVTINLPPDKK